MTKTGEFPSVRSVKSMEGLFAEFQYLESGWVFRGQSRSDWPLATSLERLAPDDKPRNESEETLLSEFKRRAHLYLGPHDLPSDRLEWLALMQHHGAPTRLLDVTHSPYVALYFAVEEADDEEPFALWAVNAFSCYRRSGAVVRRDRSEVEAFVQHMFAPQDDAAETEVLRDVAIAVMLAGARPEIMAPVPDLDLWRNQIACVVPVEPSKLSERLSLQQGAFLAPGDVNSSFMDNLANLDLSPGDVRKYEIPGLVRRRALELLRQMNITRTTLFPGLDGYAQSFRQLLIKESAEAKAVRLALQTLR